MDKKLRITDDNWTYGSYHRIHYKKDMLYTFFQYVDIHFIWNVGMGTFTLQDRLVDRLREKGLISEGTAHRYQEAALQFLSRMSEYDEWPIEQIYGQVCRIRRDVLGTEVLEQDWQQRVAFSWQGLYQEQSGWDGQHLGIDQRKKKLQLLQEKTAVILALCQPEYAPVMMEDIQAAQAAGCRVYVLAAEDRGVGIPIQSQMEWLWKTLSHNETLAEKLTYLPLVNPHLGLDFCGIAYEETLQNAVDQDQAVLLVYGEEGLLHCRNLQVESIVHAVPYGYHARAMVNQLDGERSCVVYVPRHFDITRWVRMTEKTQLSYWQLWQLWKDHGDGIYHMTPEQQYQSYPQYFLNVYENGDTCPEAGDSYPIRVREHQEEFADERMSNEGTSKVHNDRGPTITTYFDLREQAIGEYMSRQPGLTYLSTYFTEDMVEVPVPWDSKEPQTGILVHGIRVASAEKARILHCDPSRTLRQQLQEEAATVTVPNTMVACEDGELTFVNPAHRLQLCSNFLFFLTPKLAELYNQLRANRPREQLREKQGHLDYQLYWNDGRRVESFPLYRKAVLAKKRDGKFLLCQYALGGGMVKITGDQGAEIILSWTEEMVNAPDADDQIRVYTPYLSRGDDGDGMFANSYGRLIGADRVNLVMIQDQIHCIRQGDVVLPSIGVVISLSQSYGQRVLAALGLTEREDGYYDVDGLALSVTLDGPAQVDPAEWQQVEWAYGGGLTLITDGHSIYGAEDVRQMDEKHGMARLKEEGWLSPLSRQTQESALHVLVKHPRTAIGIAKNGDLFVLVFSGRTRMSTGADYQEMCHIARKLVPDVEAMMNVDGGGSSVLGMAIDGQFMELSYPATSMSSCAGMVRKVNTVLCLEP